MLFTQEIRYTEVLLLIYTTTKKHIFDKKTTGDVFK